MGSKHTIIFHLFIISILSPCTHAYDSDDSETPSLTSVPSLETNEAEEDAASSDTSSGSESPVPSPTSLRRPPLNLKEDTSYVRQAQEQNDLENYDPYEEENNFTVTSNIFIKDNHKSPRSLKDKAKIRKTALKKNEKELKRQVQHAWHLYHREKQALETALNIIKTKKPLVYRHFIDQYDPLQDWPLRQLESFLENSYKKANKTDKEWVTECLELVANHADSELYKEFFAYQYNCLGNYIIKHQKYIKRLPSESKKMFASFLHLYERFFHAKGGDHITRANTLLRETWINKYALILAPSKDPSKQAPVTLERLHALYRLLENMRKSIWRGSDAEWIDACHPLFYFNEDTLRLRNAVRTCFINHEKAKSPLLLPPYFSYDGATRLWTYLEEGRKFFEAASYGVKGSNGVFAEEDLANRLYAHGYQIFYGGDLPAGQHFWVHPRKPLMLRVKTEENDPSGSKDRPTFGEVTVSLLEQPPFEKTGAFNPKWISHAYEYFKLAKGDDLFMVIPAYDNPRFRSSSLWDLGRNNKTRKMLLAGAHKHFEKPELFQPSAVERR